MGWDTAFHEHFCCLPSKEKSLTGLKERTANLFAAVWVLEDGAVLASLCFEGLAAAAAAATPEHQRKVHPRSGSTGSAAPPDWPSNPTSCRTSPHSPWEEWKTVDLWVNLQYIRKDF